jgi:hypothetical protein
LEIFIAILSLMALILMSIALLRINNLINSYQKQHKTLYKKYSETRNTSINAEQRATNYARKIKKIEDIFIKAKEDKDPAVFTLQKIEKELFANKVLNK